ncbi:hypothetical protein Dpo_1c06150 [Desulfotignum phosphitoxidans DSM 13687]|uniref:Uncharacterized protein n=1 Tax=Desulfotignum phosphitoxidans DSM 13687 TaxID=1286635 RepID=S0G653_9BACT|nr:hypothetical protein Dpo_1c06150 [Desulfotignum phosphitoxidans DSM 13687]
MVASSQTMIRFFVDGCKSSFKKLVMVPDSIPVFERNSCAALTRPLLLTDFETSTIFSHALIFYQNFFYISQCKAAYADFLVPFL